MRRKVTFTYTGDNKRSKHRRNEKEKDDDPIVNNW